MNATDFPSKSPQAMQMRQSFLETNPPTVRFATDLRDVIEDQLLLDHFEFMTAVMEAHPIFPFEQYSFGSDLLDLRRALAYHIIVRQLGHARSLIANANIRNRIGTGVAIRCLLEMVAFAGFFASPDHRNDEHLIDLYLGGQAFLGGSWAAGSWFELETVWKKEHGEPLPEDAKSFFKKMFGLPKGSEFLKPTVSDDEGFSYLYSRYSEFVHPAFTRCRDDLEEAIQSDDPHPFGSSQYYQCETKSGAPIQLIARDISAGAFSLEKFWQSALEIDPHFDNGTRPHALERFATVYGIVTKE